MAVENTYSYLPEDNSSFLSSSPEEETYLPCSSYSITSSDSHYACHSNEQSLKFELEQRRTGDTENVVVDIQYSNMDAEMESAACNLAVYAMQQYETEQAMAQLLKEAFDRKYGAVWHSTCGRHFGSFVSVNPNSFIYFRIGGMSFILFKTSDSIEVQSGAESINRSHSVLRRPNKDKSPELAQI